MRLVFYKIFLLNVILFIVVVKGGSQNSRIIDNSNLESKINYGFILKHRSSLGYYIKGHVPACELNYNFVSDGNKIFHEVFRYPQIGAGYYFADLGNPQILGQVHAVFSYINIPFVHDHSICLNYRIAGGISYLTKCFGVSDNYYNTAIGSNFNIYVNLGINLKIRISKLIQISNGISVVHFSNGAVKVPNLGINVVSYDIGFQYKLNNKIIERRQNDDLSSFQKKNEFSVIFTNGIKEIGQPEGDKYYVYGICFNADRIINYKRKLGAGLDLFNDISIYSQFRKNDRNPDFRDVVRMGCHLSTDLIFENICLTIQQGVYIYQKYFNDGYLYSRYGLKYFTGKSIILNLSLKTHIVKADFIEFGIGYKIMQ
jgi:hypothetical protein